MRNIVGSLFWRSLKSLTAKERPAEKPARSWTASSYRPLMKLLLISVFLSAFITCQPTEASKAKKILTGEEAEAFDSWIKTKDGTEYGVGITSQKDLNKLVWIIIGQAIAWMGLLGFRIYDRATGKGDQMAKDMKEMKSAILEIQVNSRHWVTDKEVSHKVREEIRYLKEHKGTF